MKKTYIHPSMAMLMLSAKDLISTSLAHEENGKGDTVAYPKLPNI